jgi:hypothetical protein
LGLQGVASPSLLDYDGAGLNPVEGHDGAPTGPHEPRVHDGDIACNLPHARGPYITHASGGIRGGLRGILRERGRVPSYRFLHSLLQFYGLELHHLTPSGVFHIAVFVTLCEILKAP